MADIRAFRAFRYDLGRVGNLSEVICPPYDVIDEVLQERLYNRSPYNAIRLELNKLEPGDNEQRNRYARAAAFLRDWQAQDILKQDSARGFYIYQQEFEIDGRRHVRQGFFARVRLEQFGHGQVYAHEETMPGPKADRLSLLQATGLNLSPIFGLYPDSKNQVQATLDAAVGRSLPVEAVDHLGVVSRLWPITDQAVVSKVTGLLGPKPIFIADGHHRYETGWRYLQERRNAGDVAGEEAPASFILMDLVSMSDPGLLILPTHRLVSGMPGLTAEKLRMRLDGQFDVTPMGHGEDGARAAWEFIETDGSQDMLGFGTVVDGGWQVGRFRDRAAMGQLAGHHGPDWRGLAVSVLHVLVLDHILREVGPGKLECRYVHLLREVQQSAVAKACDLAVLVPPASMNHVERIAGNLEKMPPKSTYFYPKVLTGLVFNSVKSN